MDESKLNHLKNLITSAQNIIIVIGEEASFDQVASALALAQLLSDTNHKNEQFDSSLDSNTVENALADSKDHKQIRLASPKKSLGTSQLTGMEGISQELGHQSLTISFDYSEEKVDKISYHIGEEAGKFYLTVKPRVGVEPLDPKTVKYSLTGAEADLLVLFGVSELDKLDQLYFGYEELYRNTPLISFHVFETDFGTVKIDTSPFSSTAEAVYELVSHLTLEITSDPATNLLAGIEQASNCFQSRTTNAETFAIVSDLLKRGARRVIKPKVWSGTGPKTSSDVSSKMTKKTEAIRPQSKLSGNLELTSAKTPQSTKKLNQTVPVDGGKKFR